jgi:hypothetical protein
MGGFYDFKSVSEPHSNSMSLHWLMNTFSVVLRSGIIIFDLDWSFLRRKFNIGQHGQFGMEIQPRRRLKVCLKKPCLEIPGFSRTVFKAPLH